MNREERWYSIDVESARPFRLGEYVEIGAILGLAGPDGSPVRAEEAGRIVGVQHDIWQERLIVVLQLSPPESAAQRSVRRRVRTA